MVCAHLPDGSRPESTTRNRKRRSFTASCGASGPSGVDEASRAMVKPAKPEIVDQAAVEQLDVFDLAIAVALERIGIGLHQRRRARIAAHAAHPIRQADRAAAGKILDDDRREHDRHRGRCRDRHRHRIVRQIAAQRAERHRRENEGGAIVDVRGIDPDAGMLAAEQVAESRVVIEMRVEPRRKGVLAVDAAFEPARDIEQAEIGLQVFFAVRRAGSAP